jgi:membrane-bound lytic murein transglycosylase A
LEEVARLVREDELKNRRTYHHTIFQLLLVGSSMIGGCQPKPPDPVSAPPPQAKIDYTAPLPEGEVALRKIDPSQYPDFSAGLLSADMGSLKRSVDNSISYAMRPSSKNAYPYLDITHDRALASLRAFRELLNHAPFPGSSQELNQLIAQRFEVYQSIGAPRPDNTGYTNEVLFTGYFTPTYDASLTPGGPYQWPLYKRPANLITDSSGEKAGRESGNGDEIVPYYTRQDIEAGGLLIGDELCWLTSRWNAYVVTVQGSGRLRLPDGRIMEVGYAGTNGCSYTSPGRQMVADGLVPKDQLNFDTMHRYFEAHPEVMNRYLWMNQRTTFFAETHGGPFGSLNVPVTPFASIATDKKVYPPGMVAFVDARASYAGKDLAGRFMLDQDRGGAIRSAGHTDIYMGIGQSAEQLSGYQLSPGKLYYIAVRPQLISQYLTVPGHPIQ